MDYLGIIVTDDLDMKALAANYDKRMLPVRSLQAGADLLLYCNEPLSPPMALESLENALVDGMLSEHTVTACLKRISEVKKEHLQNPEPLSIEKINAIVGSAANKAISETIVKGLPSV